MEINFTDAQLKTLSDNGFTMDDLKSSVKAYREQGYSDADIKRGLWGTIKKMAPNVLTPVEFEEKNKRTWPRRVKEMQELGLQVPDYDENTSYTQRQKETYDMIQKEREKRIASSERAVRNYGRAGAFVSAAGSTATLGVSDLMMRGADAIADTGLIDFSKEAKTEHPGYAIGGSIAGMLTPGSAMKAGAKWVNGLANKSQQGIVKGAEWLAGKVPVGAKAITTTGKIAGWGTKVLENALGFQAMATMQHAAQGIAEDESFDRGEKALENFGSDTFSNATWDVALQAVGGVGGKILGVISKTKKAVNVAGGVENLKRGKDAAQAVRNAGGSEEEAAAAFYGTITENMGRKEKGLFERLLANDEGFARSMQQQAADAKQVVVDSANALTGREYSKLSQTVLENAWGTAKNKLGKYEVDFTKKGLDQLLGLDNTGPVMEARKQAIGRAQVKVASNPSLGRDVKNTFDELKYNLKAEGSRDLERAYKSVEPGTLKSFEGSVEQTDAIVNAQKRIAATEKNIGRPLEPGEVEKIMGEELRDGAERHFRNLMANGTDSIIDINDIKTHFDKTFVQEIEAGQAEAVGKFAEGINSRILDQVDDTLYQANQAMRLGKKLQKIHDFGGKYTNANFNELESMLNNGVDAKEKAMKLAVFKMGMLNKASEAVASGQPGALENMRSLMTNSKLKKYFTTEEVGSYIDQLKPKAEAAHTLNGILNTAYSLRGEDTSVLAPMIRAGVSGTILHSPNMFMNSLITLIYRISPYGPKTAKFVDELAHNPDWKTFNRLVKGVDDPAEKNFLRQQIVMAFEATREQQQGE